MSVKTKILLNQLKSNAIKLRTNYQIPYYLCYFIRFIDDKTNESIIKEFMVLTEHYLRVKGYYQKYPDISDLADEEIKRMFAVKDNKLIKLKS